MVGAVANSILQGSLIISDTAFTRHFPDDAGWRMFLIDVPPADAAAASPPNLTRALQDRGLELTPAVDRLNAFNAVQNTYLDTFQVLGGLGLLLGSAGLGVVVLRNVLERRGELAVLMAVRLPSARPCAGWCSASTPRWSAWDCWLGLPPRCAGAAARLDFAVRARILSFAGRDIGLWSLSAEFCGRGPPPDWPCAARLLRALRNE